MDATVHWHGLRLENRYDGTHETQQPMAVGERFSARVAFPESSDWRFTVGATGFEPVTSAV